MLQRTPDADKARALEPTADSQQGGRGLGAADRHIPFQSELRDSPTRPPLSLTAVASIDWEQRVPWGQAQHGVGAGERVHGTNSVPPENLRGLVRLCQDGAVGGTG